MSPGWQAVRTLVDDSVAAGATPAVALVVGAASDIRHELYAGTAGERTVFDLSSLTKPLATVAAIPQPLRARTSQ